MDIRLVYFITVLFIFVQVLTASRNVSVRSLSSYFDENPLGKLR